MSFRKSFKVERFAPQMTTFKILPAHEQDHDEQEDDEEQDQVEDGVAHKVGVDDGLLLRPCATLCARISSAICSPY